VHIPAASLQTSEEDSSNQGESNSAEMDQSGVDQYQGGNEEEEEAVVEHNSRKSKLNINLLSCWKIRYGDLGMDKAKKLGEGAFATCYKVSYNNFNDIHIIVKGTLYAKPVAIKVLNAESIDESLMKEFHQEVNVLSMLRHPNIVLCILIKLFMKLYHL
jgi:hypothetical protein